MVGQPVGPYRVVWHGVATVETDDFDQAVRLSREITWGAGELLEWEPVERLWRKLEPDREDPKAAA